MPLPGLSGQQSSGRMDLKNLARFRSLSLLAQSVVEGFITGLHKSPFKGFAVEFEEHRQYVPGDDLKHLDWKILAKSDRYYVKQYETDTSLRAYLVLDASGSMGYGSGRFSKYDCGRFVVAALAYMLLGQEDSVGLVSCTSRIRDFLPPRATATHMKNILQILERTEAEEDTGLGEVLHSLANRIKRRGLIVIISDFFDSAEDVIRALNHFAHKKHEVIVYQVVDRNEATFPFSDMTRFESMEGEEVVLTDPLRLRREYLRQFEEHQNRLREACYRLRIDFVQFFTDEPLERSLAQYLAGRMKRGK
jgi:uncharacterized protein (DUF58 family)